MSGFIRHLAGAELDQLRLVSKLVVTRRGIDFHLLCLGLRKHPRLQSSPLIDAYSQANGTCVVCCGVARTNILDVSPPFLQPFICFVIRENNSSFLPVFLITDVSTNVKWIFWRLLLMLMRSWLCTRTALLVPHRNNAAQSQNAVSAYFTSKWILPFGFTGQNSSS